MLGQHNIPKTKSRIAHLLVIAFLITVVLSGYWLKCRVGIDFFENYTLSKYFPFNYIIPNNVIDDPSPGMLIDDSFNSFSLFSNWSHLWSREKERATRGYDSHGIDDSRCLLIKSSSDKSWSYSYKKYFRVKKGDKFSFKVSVKLQGDKLSAYARVIAFDESKDAVSWSYISEKIDKTDEWVTMERAFIISDEISFIKFKVSGNGVGEYRFDDISFSKK